MSELAQPLAEAADRLFSQRCDSRLVASADAGQWPQALWSAVDELGPGQLLAPESAGGAGGDWLDACTLLERAAAHCVPLPIGQTLLAGWLRSRAGLRPVSGPAALAFTAAPLAAMREAGRADAAESDDAPVPWAEHAHQIAFVGADPAGTAQLLWLPKGCMQTRPVTRSFPPSARVTCAGVALHAPASAEPARAWCVPLPGLSLTEVRARAALLTAAQMAGALGRLLDMTLAYTGERVQFGRSIGQFQAVQHQLAQLAEEAAAARVAVHAAAATEDPHCFVAAAAAAKVRAGEAASLAARIAHQLHGAIGVTAEHALHLSTRRLCWWRDEHGSEAFWARALVQALRDGGMRSAWQAAVACTSR